MKGLRIYIVEDEPLIAETIKTILNEEGYVVCGESDNAKEALFDIENLKPDLVLADIMLDGEIDGIEMITHLKKRNNIPFIFLTSLSDADTLERVKATNPSGFIVKPFNENTLTTNIDLAYYKHQSSKPSFSINQESDSFFIKNKGELLKIFQNDILYIEAYDNYCNLFTNTRKHLISHTLKSIEAKLAGTKFLRVHRSYIINFSKIDSIQDGYVFIGKHKIPVSKSYKVTLMKALNLL